MLKKHGRTRLDYYVLVDTNVVAHVYSYHLSERTERLSQQTGHLTEKMIFKTKQLALRIR